MTTKTGAEILAQLNDHWRYEVDDDDTDKLNLRVELAGGGGGAYDPALQANRSFAVNADHLHYIYDEFSLANAPNKADYYHYVDMSSYRQLTAQLVLETTGSSGTITVTVQAANEDAAAGGDIPLTEWVDVGTLVYGTGSWLGPAGAKTTVYLSDSSKIAGGFKWVRFTVAVAGGSSDVSYEIFAKRLY